MCYVKYDCGCPVEEDEGGKDEPEGLDGDTSGGHEEQGGSMEPIYLDGIEHYVGKRMLQRRKERQKQRSQGKDCFETPPSRLC